MDTQAFAYVHELMKLALEPGEPRDTLENFFTALRQQFVFDNVAIYLQGEDANTLDIVYARAVGRAKTAEADAAWGEMFAGQVLARGTLLLQEPQQTPARDDRLKQAYLLGLPLSVGGAVKGAVVFVRFGSPRYEQEHLDVAQVGAELLTLMYERRAWRQMSRELNALKMQMQLQDDFVSTISHELRTPLGFIKGYSTSLLRKDTSWDAETQEEFLTIIDEEADRLSLLIENVLESARLQSKTLPLRFQPLRLDAVLRDVVTRLRTRFKDLQVELDLQSSPPTQGDGVRIAQVFDNLFTNAIKYAPGSPIHVRLRRVGENILIAVEDEGPGIPPESLARIFERFYRARSEKATGTGLGLFICKQIIDAHRGKIWAESTLDQGTTFFIELPIIPAV